MSPERLSPSARVWAISEAPHLTPHALGQLGSSTDPLIRIGAACHPRCPRPVVAAVLRSLVDEAVGYASVVRLTVFARDDLPPAWRSRLWDESAVLDPGLALLAAITTPEAARACLTTSRVLAVYRAAAVADPPDPEVPLPKDIEAFVLTLRNDAPTDE